MRLIVELGNSFSQGLDTGRGAVLSGRNANVDCLGSLEATGNFVLDFRGALAKIGPRIRLIHEAILVGSLSTPDDTSRRSAGIQAGVGHVAFVRIAELSVDLGLELYKPKSCQLRATKVQSCFSCKKKIDVAVAAAETLSVQYRLAVAIKLRGRGNPAWELGSLQWRGSSKHNQAKSSATAAFDGRHWNTKREKGKQDGIVSCGLIDGSKTAFAAAAVATSTFFDPVPACRESVSV